jgi:hypothetical protein
MMQYEKREIYYNRSNKKVQSIANFLVAANKFGSDFTNKFVLLRAKKRAVTIS